MAIKKELFRFLISGASAVLTDMITYFLLSKYCDENIAKGISFLIGTIVAFVLNKFWTFERKEKSYNEAFRFITLYLITLALNILVNYVALTWVWDQKMFGFIMTTGASATLNFIGQKFWVFK